MCGIAGFVEFDVDDPRLAMGRMLDALGHRGPDDRGSFVDEGAAIGMTRLAIVDIAGGDQPKSAANGDIQVVFNGEIYNFAALRTELEGRGHAFSTHSDTEVVTKAYAEWGDDAFHRLHGMFAIAVWERRRRRLVLARDRIGKKPLYVWRRGRSVAFASELKALRTLGPFAGIDEQAVAEFFHQGYVPTPRSIWREVSKVRAGHVATFVAGELTTRPFWELDVDAPPLVPSDPVGELEARLLDAVAARLVADVEVGVLLSGGIDSSLVAWAAAQQHAAIRTFTIAFDDPALDESEHAAAVASKLGTTHEQTLVTGKEALDTVGDLPQVYDEPFADSSGIPTLLVSRFAGRHVKVVLGGDGGDELFDGYGHYRAFAEMQRLRRYVPGPLRKAGRPLARSTITPVSRLGNVVDKLDRNDAVTYRNVVAVLAPGLLREVLGRTPDLEALSACYAGHFGRYPERSARAADLHHYLPDDVLVKVDRASMSAGLEVRAPFLETSLVEWAFRLPRDVLGPPGSKAVPRELLRRHLGPALADRPKQGFGVPLERWLQGPLRPLLEDRLSPAALGEHGLVRPSGVRLLLDRLAAGRRGVATPLWAVLMFQLWYDRWGR